MNPKDLKTVSKFKKGKTCYRESSSKKHHPIDEVRSTKVHVVGTEENKTAEMKLNHLSFHEKNHIHDNHTEKGTLPKRNDFNYNQLTENNDFYDNFHKMLKDENNKSVSHKKKPKHSNKSHIVIDSLENFDDIIKASGAAGEDKIVVASIERVDEAGKLKKVKTIVLEKKQLSRLNSKKIEAELDKKESVNLVPEKQKKKSCCFPFFQW